MGIGEGEVNLVISTNLAKRIRESGLVLPISHDYENEQVKAIALCQWELLVELDKLDEELRECC